MAVQGEGGNKDEIKTQFTTIEGLYKLLPMADYSRPNRLSYNNSTPCSSTLPVRLSFVNLPDNSTSNCVNSCTERSKICYNYGRDLCVYTYRGIKKEADLSKPIEKRSYSKEDLPTCHDFNNTLNCDRVLLLVGLFGGQIQLFDPLSKELNKTFNAGERLIDKTRVTCIKWIPGAQNQFIVSHASGHMYIYNEELSCGLDRPSYQLFKQGEGYNVYTCKAKSSRNPLYKWTVGEGCVNEFAFSPCAKYLAIVSQDGFLRVFNFDTMDLLGIARSYYGGFICVCWSPDSKYVVTGGEDDLITIWSLQDRKVVARGQGHRSWVTVVAFDEYTTVYGDTCSSTGEEGSMCNAVINGKTSCASKAELNSAPNSIASDDIVCNVTSYRLGSVGQDTLLCLWDLKEDSLKQPYFRPRSSTNLNASKSFGQNSCSKVNNYKESLANNDSYHSSNSFTTKLASLNFADRRDKCDKEHKRSHSLTSKASTLNSKTLTNKNQVGSLGFAQHTLRLMGTPACPRMTECPVIEPMVCKKIGEERLCGLVFREDCIITACQDGIISTWCRPGKVPGAGCGSKHSSSSPTATAVGGGQSHSGGTVV